MKSHISSKLDGYSTAGPKEIKSFGMGETVGISVAGISAVGISGISVIVGFGGLGAVVMVGRTTGTDELFAPTVLHPTMATNNTNKMTLLVFIVFSFY
jgi:hypothetical protein